MHKKIIKYIKDIPQKPEETRKSIMWVLVLFSMIIVFGIWWFEFIGNKPRFERMENASPMPYPPDLRKVSEGFNDLKNNLSAANKPTDAEVAELEKIAEDYLKYGIFTNSEQVTDLKLKDTEKKDEKWILRYNQYYKDILVDESDIYFVIDPYRKKVISYGSNFDSAINIDVASKITSAEAYGVVGKKMNGKGLILKNSQLVIRKDASGNPVKYYLAWKLNVTSTEPAGDHYYLVDAKNGMIIADYDF